VTSITSTRARTPRGPDEYPECNPQHTKSPQDPAINQAKTPRWLPTQITSAAIFVAGRRLILLHAYRPDLRPYHAEIGDFPFFYFYLLALHAARGDRRSGIAALLQRRLATPGRQRQRRRGEPVAR